MMPRIPIPAPAPPRWKRPGIRPRSRPTDNRAQRRDKADLRFKYQLNREIGFSRLFFPMLWKPLKLEDLKYNQMSDGWAAAFKKYSTPEPCVQE